MSEAQQPATAQKKKNFFNNSQTESKQHQLQRIPYPAPQEQEGIATDLSRAPSDLLRANSSTLPARTAVTSTATLPSPQPKVQRQPSKPAPTPAPTITRISTPKPTPIQPKLSVNEPNDSYEQEADRVADAVMRMPDWQLTPTTPPPDEGNSPNPIQAKLIQRACTDCEQETAVMRAAETAVPNVTPDIESRIDNMNGNGSPIADQDRSFFEQRMGYDFSNVRIHTDSTAVQTSRDLNAKAFTVGNNIAFNTGEYAPGTASGRRLLAHELTHTVQQGATVQRLQREADEGVCPTCGKIGEVGTSCECGQFFVPTSNLQRTIQRFRTDQEETQPRPDITTEIASTTNENEQSSFEQKDLIENKSLQSGIEDAQTEKKEPIDPSSDQTPTNRNEEVVPQTTEAQELPKTRDGLEPIQKPEAPKQEILPETETSTEIATPAPEPQPAEDVPIPQASEAVEENSDSDIDDAPELEGGAELVAEADVSISPADEGAIAEPVGGAGMPSGGGSGGTIEQLPPVEVPDVSQAEPASAMGAITGLPPVTLYKALGGVSQAAGNFTNKQQEELANNPPEMERPSGSPSRHPSEPTPIQLPDPAELQKVEKTPEGADKPTPEPPPEPAPPTPAAANASPPSSPESVGSAVANIPSKDPNTNTDPGAPPKVELSGNADPSLMQTQEQELHTSINQTQAEGRNEAAMPMGEHDIYPIVPEETLQAEISAGATEMAAAEAELAEIGGLEGISDESLSIVVQEEKGAEIETAVAAAQGELATEQENYKTQIETEQEASKAEIDTLVAENETAQETERQAALTEVDTLRQDWAAEQDQLVADAQAEATETRQQGLQDIQQEQEQANQKATEHIEEGKKEAEEAKAEGERNAKAEKDKGQEKSGGFFDGLLSSVTDFFNEIKEAVQSALEAAQKLIKAAIEKAKELATAVIEAARKAVVAIIETIGNVLIAIGDRLLAAFPELRERFRTFIQEKVNQAVEAVNQFAEQLKEDVQNALDRLGQVLTQALDLLQKGLTLVIEKAQGLVEGAINTVKSAIEAFAAFAVLIEDIAANPGQWLSNLGLGAEDGIVNHLWNAFTTKVQEWFQGKVEEILGLGATVWQILQEGGWDLARIGKLAWDALVEAIPSALISILIEKVVAMIIPAAGAIMAIIEGLQAAWGTVSQIIQAMDAFISFLKQVKSGDAGPSFATMLATAAIVVVDFVSNWLISKLKSAGKKVANKLKGIADKLFGKAKKKKNKKDKPNKFDDANSTHTDQKSKRVDSSDLDAANAKDIKIGNKNANQTKDNEARNNEPYNPHQWRQYFEDTYGHDNVTSSTVPQKNAPGVKWAGSKHPKTNIPYDVRGFVIFDAHTKVDLNIGSGINKSYSGQMNSATQQLRNSLENGSINRSEFTPKQLLAIQQGKSKIPGYTWHHHQDRGRMQLVPEKLHNQTKPHTGGGKLW